MTPQEKAKEIYDQMKGFRVKNTHRKKCALVCVQNIIGSYQEVLKERAYHFINEQIDFYREVSIEINNL